MHPKSFSRARTATRITALGAALVLATTALVVTGSPAPAGASTDPCTLTTPPELLAGSTDVFEIDSADKLIHLSLNFDEPVTGVTGISGDWREQDFVQTVDIDLGGCLFTPIGTQTFTSGVFGGDPFTGSYDGQDNTIEGLRIHVVDQAGLFGGAFNAAFARVRLIEVDVIAEAGAPGRAIFASDAGLQAGALVADLAGGSVADSSATGSVAGAVSVGGLIGVSDGAITNSSATVEVTGDEKQIGGLVGIVLGGSITDSSATGAVIAGGADDVGGLVGASFDADITDSHATGDVTSTGDKVGGLVGHFADGSIENSHATGDVEGRDSVGGLVGELEEDFESTILRYSFATGNVTGTSTVGGLVGKQNASIVSSYATGDVTSTGDKVGGLVGVHDGKMDDSYATGDVVGNSDVGGLVGDAGGTSTTTASFFRATTSDPDAGALDGADFRSFASFGPEGAEWPIVAGWAPFDAPSTVWGICSAVNEGRPFLLWQFTADPCRVTPPTPPTASTPVLTGGVAPALPAGQGVWQQTDGTSTPLDVAAPASNQLRYEADGVRVTLTGTNATDPSRGLVADPAGEIVCEVCVAAPAGQVIEVWMFSTPRLVAAHRIDSDECQVFAVPLSAPLDGQGPVTAGAHTLQFAIPTEDGMQAIDVGVTVGGPVPASIPAGEGTITEPLDRTGGTLLVALLIAVAAALRTPRRISTTIQQ